MIDFSTAAEDALALTAATCPLVKAESFVEMAAETLGLIESKALEVQAAWLPKVLASVDTALPGKLTTAESKLEGLVLFTSLRAELLTPLKSGADIGAL